MKPGTILMWRGIFLNTSLLSVENIFLFSDRIGRSALGLVERSSASVHWDEVTDLKKYFIGVVRGYVNTTSFDSMVEAGEIRVDESVSDLFNLRKVLAGRVDMAVADINLFNYWSNFDEQLSSRRES